MKKNTFKIPSKRQYVVGFFLVVALLAVGKHLLSDGDGSEVHQAVEQQASFKPHRIWSVPSYKNAFPDGQDVQILAAEKNGVRPVQNRENAEKRMKELVYVAANPYFHVDKLKSSIPYLVPRAAVLLQDIGQSFYDSLYKGRSLEPVDSHQCDALDGRRGALATPQPECYGTFLSSFWHHFRYLLQPLSSSCQARAV